MISSENYLTGAILIDSGAVPIAQRYVRPCDFGDERCRAIYSAALDLKGAGKVVDPVSIKEQAAHHGIPLENDYLAQLMDITPTAANAADYARRVAEDSRKRQLKGLLDKVQQNEIESLDKTLSVLREGVRELSEGVPGTGLLTPDDSLREFMDYVTKGNSRSNFIPSRFPILDKTLGGGFIRGGLYIVGARPAVGKSSFAVNLADTIRGNVLLVSLEMAPAQITGKRVSRRTGIPTGQLLAGKINEEEWTKVIQASNVLLKSGVHLNDRYDLTVPGIQSLAEGVPNLQAIIVDYLGLILPTNRGGSTYENTTQISRGLKRLALALNVPIICLCQLSRSVESREDKRPRLSDLRDSGAIEQDADGVLFLYRDDYYKGATGDESHAILSIAKNRHGGLGTIDFKFHRAISRFLEVP